jgi:hypothetical protein
MESRRKETPWHKRYGFTDHGDGIHHDQKIFEGQPDRVPEYSIDLVPPNDTMVFPEHRRHAGLVSVACSAVVLAIVGLSVWLNQTDTKSGLPDVPPVSVSPANTKSQQVPKSPEPAPKAGNPRPAVTHTVRVPYPVPSPFASPSPVPGPTVRVTVKVKVPGPTKTIKVPAPTVTETETVTICLDIDSVPTECPAD